MGKPNKYFIRNMYSLEFMRFLNHILVIFMYGNPINGKSSINILFYPGIIYRRLEFSIF